MELLKNRQHQVILFGILLAYLLTRLIRLTTFPMLNDESIYLHWAQEILKDSSNLTLPVTEGRQPFFIWLISLSMHLIPDPLFAGRIVSVFAGFISMIGLCLTTHEIFRKKEYTLFTAVLYIVSPFALVYDRLAFLDSLVTSFTVFSIYLTLLLVRQLRLDLAYTLGFVIGGALLTKSNGIFSLILLPFSVILMNVKKVYKDTLVKWILLLIIVFIVSQVVQSIITIIPKYSRILDVNQIFIIPKKEFIHMPIPLIISIFLTNLQKLFGFFLEYFTVPYVLMILSAFIFHKKNLKEKLWLIVYFLIPLFVFSLFARQVMPRYIHPMAIPLIPLSSVGAISLYYELKRLYNNKKKNYLIYKLLFYFLLMAIPLFMSVNIINDLRKSTIPLIDRQNYAAKEETFINKSITKISKESKNKKVLLITEGYIGWSPNMYQVLLNNNKNVTVTSVINIKDRLPNEVARLASNTATFVVIPRFDKDNVKTDLTLEKILEEKTYLEDGEEKKLYYFRMYHLKN